MNRSFYICALLLGTAATLTAQQASSPNPYTGVSDPPPDSTITTPAPQPPPKPSPAKPMNPAPQSQAQPPAAQQPMVIPSATYAAPDSTNGTDSGIVQVEPDTQSQPVLTQRAESSDPDGDIVHPAPLPPGTLDVGTMIRARLLDRISTTYSREGDTFRAQVASDVFRGNNILIPVGSEIDGTIVQVSNGHFGGHGSMLLRPETVTLPDGSRYRMYAQLSGAPGTNTRVNDEGSVAPGPRTKQKEIEYSGGVGVGVVTGAVLGGPVGALAGSLVGASAVTVHLLMDHPQATLATGTVLDFTLTEPLSLVATTANNGQ